MELDEVFTKIYAMLQEATQDTGDQWRICSLATVDGKGFPRVRKVVLRGVEGDFSLLAFTDTRSAKWQELLGNPRVELLFWCAERKEQLRCSAEVALREGNEVLRYRENLPASAAGDYAAVRSPGAGLSCREEGRELGEIWSFGVMVMRVVKIDWLRLSREGHLRASYERLGGEWRSRWVQP